MVPTTVRPAALALMLALSAAATADDDSKPVPVSKATAEAAAKVTCRTVKMTGSNLRTRKVCSTPDSQAGAGDWLRQQQDRGGLNASATLNNGN